MHMRSVERFGPTRHRHERLRRHRRQRRRRRHRRSAAQAGHDPRRPARGQQRASCESVIAQAAAASPDAVFVCVTNPLDIMTYLAWKESGPARPSACSGMGGVLDSARFAFAIAEKTGAPIARHLGARDGRARRRDGADAALHDRRRHVRSPSCSRQPTSTRSFERTVFGGAEVVGAAQDRLGVLRAGGQHRRDGARDPRRHRRGAAELRATCQASTASTTSTCPSRRDSGAAGCSASRSCPSTTPNSPRCRPRPRPSPRRSTRSACEAKRADCAAASPRRFAS